jgi:hypothetical protein
MPVWRVGYFASPCGFTPHHLCSWNHRFDDPKREYRTIYAADRKETCLREVLADLRPDRKALAEFKKIFGDDAALEAAGQVTRAWREKHVLANADIVIDSGAMADIESAPVLADLSRRLGNRDLTRAASRLLHDDGRAGIDFRSRLDRAACHALFEGRAHLDPIDVESSLSDEVPELISVCREYGLKLS